MGNKINKNDLKKNLATMLMANKAVWIVIILGIGLTFATPLFLTSGNILNVLRQVCVSATVAVGFTLILASGEIDLSVGSQLAFVGIVMAKLMVGGVAWPIAIGIGILVSVACSIVTASMVTFLKLPSFIVTMAMSQVLRGTVYLATRMVPVTNLPKGFSVIGQGYWLGIPIPVYIMFIMMLIVWVITNRTMFGRYVLAFGGNAEATRISGINTNKVRIGVFALMGASVAVASVIATSRAASAQTSAGYNMEMDAIAAVVIGGTSMKGGNANVIGSLFGCLVVGMVSNALNLLGIDSNWQVVVKGLLILVAILIDKFSTDIIAKFKN